MKRFEGKVAWVTGGGSGIGRGLALELAREGATVVVSGRRAAELERVRGECEALGARATAVPCDVTKDAEVAAAVAKIVAELGRLDVAIANAGAGSSAAFERLSDDDFRRQFAVNVFGVASTARHALPELRKTGGRLAIVGSVNSLVSIPGASLYAATKFAVRGLGLALAQELHGSGVSLTMIYPGFVESEIALVDRSGKVDPSRKDPRPKALMWSAERAARVTLRALHRRRREFVFTGHGRFGAFVGQHWPGLVHAVMSRAAPKILRVPSRSG